MRKVKPLSLKKSGLDKKEWLFLKSLKNPAKIQDFINLLPFNIEDNGETCMSVKRTLRIARAHCFEGALVAAAALWIQGYPPLLLDLRAINRDDDHVVVPFRKNGFWGAISKTNHAVLRYREPIYKTIRELALSYFHEYFLSNGMKTLRSYSKPFNLARQGTFWLTSLEELFKLENELNESAHVTLVTKNQIKFLRKADRVEIKAGEIKEYP